MKIILCACLVSIIGFSNGTPQIGIVENSFTTKLYSNWLPHISTNVSPGFISSGVPYRINYGAFDTLCTQQLTDEIVLEFRINYFRFMALVYKKATVLAEGHVVFSPYTAWLTFAALSEGMQGPTQYELFKLLNLPDDICLRKLYYKLALSREPPSNEVTLARNRLFIADSSLRVNDYWANFVRSYTGLNKVSIPFKTNPNGEIEALKQIFKAQLPNLNLNGNSFLLESLDYHGLWTSAFSEGVVESGPFYNTFGEQIGTMEYMKTKKRVRTAYLESHDTNFVEIPLGRDNRYVVYIATPLRKQHFPKSLNSISDDLLFQMLDNLRLTPAPIEIVIPRMTMTTEVDMRSVMEGVGIDSLWTDASVTSNISIPAALPSTFIQRVTVTFDKEGLRPSAQEFYNFVPSLPTEEQERSPNVLREFVANRPFMFAVFETELYTLLYAGSFNKPYA